MALFFFFVVLTLHILYADADAFKMYKGPSHFHTFFQKRSGTQPQQCVLVTPSIGVSLPSTAGGNGDQSPLLPGPSRSAPGTIQAQSACGDIGATDNISPLSGPNGAISWMTCGINSTGWTPSYATVSDIIAADLTSALNQGNSPFQACSSVLSIIEKYSAQYKGIVRTRTQSQQKVILTRDYGQCLLSLSHHLLCKSPAANQTNKVRGVNRVSCRFLRTNGAPNGNCKDPDFNIHQGTQFLANTLAANNGNILVTIGEYNGWYKGMTYAKATAAASTSCCHCQQNLDYIFQMLNGWVLNRNPLAQPRLGEYFNLDVCGS